MPTCTLRRAQSGLDRSGFCNATGPESTASDSEWPAYWLQHHSLRSASETEAFTLYTMCSICSTPASSQRDLWTIQTRFNVQHHPRRMLQLIQMLWFVHVGVSDVKAEVLWSVLIYNTLLLWGDILPQSQAFKNVPLGYRKGRWCCQDESVNSHFSLTI